MTLKRQITKVSLAALVATLTACAPDIPKPNYDDSGLYQPPNSQQVLDYSLCLAPDDPKVIAATTIYDEGREVFVLASDPDFGEYGKVERITLDDCETLLFGRGKYVPELFESTNSSILSVILSEDESINIQARKKDDPGNTNLFFDSLERVLLSDAYFVLQEDPTDILSVRKIGSDRSSPGFSINTNEQLVSLISTENESSGLIGSATLLTRQGQNFVYRFKESLSASHEEIVTATVRLDEEPDFISKSPDSNYLAFVYNPTIAGEYTYVEVVPIDDLQNPIAQFDLSTMPISKFAFTPVQSDNSDPVIMYLATSTPFEQSEQLHTGTATGQDHTIYSNPFMAINSEYASIDCTQDICSALVNLENDPRPLVANFYAPDSNTWQ